jgi:glycosyltransferase involved in cell wall biosynthesis
MTDCPRVTVFIPVYNRARYVGPAIESILGQSYTDFEILLVDDGSTDESVEVMRSYGEPRVRVVENKKNLGLPYTRNRGLELAQGEYIALLDSDDLSLPDRLACQVEFLDAHPDYAEVGAWSQAMDASGQPLRKVKIQPTAAEETRATLLFRCSIKNRSLMGRTAMMRELGYRADFPRCQDYDLHVRLAERHLLGNIPRVLVLGRVHPLQWTGSTTEIGNAAKMRIMREQLEPMGVEPNEEDLWGHLLLAHQSGETGGRRIDAAYLDWADDWLSGLRRANARTRRYERTSISVGGPFAAI